MKYLTLITAIFIFATSLISCGGGGDSPAEQLLFASGPPLNMASNAGSTIASIGWQAPLDDGGTPLLNYELQVVPAVSASNIQISDTQALIKNLINDMAYEFSVVAINAVGASAASDTITVTPKDAATTNYRPLTIAGEPGSPSGIYDPSLVQGGNGTHWLAYSSVNFYNDGAGDLVQDVGIRLASSLDGGDNFSYVATVASPYDGTVTDSDPALSACGLSVCNGRWVYETAWLVEDSNDPDTARRFKLFAHKYFVYPPRAGSKTLYHLGAIVMWTSSSPDNTWSAETVVLGWPLTTPDLTPNQDLTLLDAETAMCILAAEGGITVHNNGLNLVFACPYNDPVSSTIVQKIILLRSTNNASSFEYVSTLLTPADAPTGVEFFSAPSLIATEDSAPILLATPVVSGVYAGSMAFAFSDDNLLALFREGGQASVLLFVPVQAAGHFGGASSYARGSRLNGVFQSDATIAATLVDTQFNIIATQAMVDQ